MDSSLGLGLLTLMRVPDVLFFPLLDGWLTGWRLEVLNLPVSGGKGSPEMCVWNQRGRRPTIGDWEEFVGIIDDYGCEMGNTSGSHWECFQ